MQAPAADPPRRVLASREGKQALKAVEEVVERWGKVGAMAVVEKLPSAEHYVQCCPVAIECLRHYKS